VEVVALGCLPVLVAARLRGLYLAAGEGGGFEDALVAQSGFLVGLAGGYTVRLFGVAHYAPGCNTNAYTGEVQVHIIIRLREGERLQFSRFIAVERKKST
jgi:hypothetical protein